MGEVTEVVVIGGSREVADGTEGVVLLSHPRMPGLRGCVLRPPLACDWAHSGRGGTEHVASLGIDMEITQRQPGTRGFIPIPKRWAVGRTYGWLMLHRCLVRDCETLPVRSEAMIHIAMTDLMTCRLTSGNTVSWRDPTRQTKQQIPG